MELNQPASSLLEETIKQTIGKYTCGCEQTTITDIHLQVNQSLGEFCISDDDDRGLSSTVIREWMTCEGDDFHENIERILNNLLYNMKSEDTFDKLTITRPFSFVLVDDDKETIVELLLLDDDALLINKELLKGLDKELGALLKDLLEKQTVRVIRDHGWKVAIHCLIV